jgi:large subunit ribosomal protein L3
MNELFGKKLGMTRIFQDDGSAVPVTILEAGPCPVVAVRTGEGDGYDALQLGFEEVKESRLTRAQLGHFKKAGVAPMRYLREVRVDDAGETKPGDIFKVDEIFKEGEKVDVVGTSRGLGFAGTMKRHHFSGANKTHGQSDRWRAPGSVGQSSYPSRVFKGLRMAGRMGHDTVTVLGLRVVKIIPEENLILIKGAVPGKRNGFVRIRKSNRR